MQDEMEDKAQALLEELEEQKRTILTCEDLRVSFSRIAKNRPRIFSLSYSQAKQISSLTEQSWHPNWKNRPS
jgi:hypothetical protein